jgi:AcrR family transcriptional regulator
MTMTIEAATEPATAPEAPEKTRDKAKLRQILDGARKVFLSDGFDGASMNDIARVAGVSKGTLYVYFDSKEALFESLVRNEKQMQAEASYPYQDSEDDLEITLRKVAHGLCGMLTRPDSIAIVRMVIGVSGKFPAIGRAFYEAGPQYGREQLAAYLDRHVAAGRLRIDDTQQAASNLLHLAHSDFVKAQLFGMIDHVTEAEITRSVENAVQVFMRAYGTQHA